MHGRNRGLRLAVLLAAMALPGGEASARGTGPSLSLNPTENHPKSSIQVSGADFRPFEAVDIYFDTTDEALTTTNGSGGFSNVPIPAPAKALPGTHYISAVERRNGQGAQQIFTVDTDWAEFQFDKNLKGRNSWENVLTTGNVSSLDEAWTGQTKDIVESSPAVAGGVVYVGSNDGILYAFDAATGAPVWGFQLGSYASVTSPTVANGMVYVTSSDGVLYAINASNAETVWYADLGNGVLYSAPAVVNGIVYIGCTDDNLYAFNASTGALLWKAATGSIIEGSPSVSNGVVYIGSFDDNLYAFNASSGALLWKSATGDRIEFASPAVAKGVVYVGSNDGYLYAFDAGSGATIWKTNTGSVNSSPAVADGVVYVDTGEGMVYALNAATGAQLWTAGGTGYGYSSPAVANGVVYVGTCSLSTDNASILGLDAATGTVLWSAATGGECIDASPAISNGMVYIGSWDNNVYAWALNGGNDPAYRKKHKGPAMSSLHPDYKLKPSN